MKCIKYIAIGLLLMLIISIDTWMQFAHAIQECEDDVAKTTPTLRFTNNNDGTVSDNKTGLIWARCQQGLMGPFCTKGSATEHTWSQALALTKATSDTGGNTDWRLPNIKELESIVERACFSPAINQIIFPNTSNTDFWSATPSTIGTIRAWEVFFRLGSVNHGFRMANQSVRLVRDRD